VGDVSARVVTGEDQFGSQGIVAFVTDRVASVRDIVVFVADRVALDHRAL
jgi:hypothetical protein